MSIFGSCLLFEFTNFQFFNFFIFLVRKREYSLVSYDDHFFAWEFRVFRYRWSENYIFQQLICIGFDSGCWTWWAAFWLWHRYDIFNTVQKFILCFEIAILLWTHIYLFIFLPKKNEYWGFIGFFIFLFLNNWFFNIKTDLVLGWM